MPLSRTDVHYFGAGPAPLPTAVLEAAGAALLNYNGTGVGLAEMSHRSPEAAAVLRSCQDALRDFWAVPDDYDILFTQGGGSGQFSAVVYHMVGIFVQRLVEELGLAQAADAQFTQLRDAVHARLRADYLVTGSWSLKASQEAARLVGQEHVHIVTDARRENEGKFGTIPPESAWDVPPAQPAFTYYCDNETVDGVEFPAFPAALEAKGHGHDRLVVADMSSNILSRRVDVAKYAAIFAGAQKNVATPGVTLVVVRKDLLAQPAASSELMRRLGLAVGPVALDWPTIAKNNSLYNTLPIFDVWVAGQVIAQLLETHGSKKIDGQEAVSNAKAAKVYAVLEAHPDVYAIVPAKHVRSRMNICFRLAPGHTQDEDKLIQGAKAQGLTGIKGHRSVGGLRVSNYNAVGMQSVDKLVAYLEQFAKSP